MSHILVNFFRKSALVHEMAQFLHKTYVMGTHLKCLKEKLPLSTTTIAFMELSHADIAFFVRKRKTKNDLSKSTLSP